MSFLWIPKSIRHRTEYSFFYENVELPTNCIKTRQAPRTPLIFGSAPSVLDRWWSSRDSRLPKCNFVLHRWSPLPHETTLSINKILRVSPRPRRGPPYHRTNLFFRLPQWLALRYFLQKDTFRTRRVIRCAPPHRLGASRRQPLPTFNFHRARVRRAGGLVQTAVSNARRAACPTSHLRENARPIQL